MSWSVPVLSALFPALLLACQPRVEPAPQTEPDTPARPNFVIVDIDSMRADLLDATHQGEPLAPAIHSLAQRGVRFDNAFAQSSWTFPALASVLTGRYPPSFATLNPRRQQLAELGNTLPAILNLYGYHSAAAWGDTAPTAYPAFGQGFDDAPLDQLERLPEPFLLMVHDMDLHRPLPQPSQATIERHSDQRPVPRCESLNETWKRGREQVGELAAQQQVRACYRAALEAYDPQVAQIMAQLEATGLDDRTVVILLSNHGEELFEHGEMGHAELQYDTVLRVPLVILDPAVAAPARRDERVQHVDLVPTILARANIPPPHDLDGASLLPLLGLSEGTYPERDIFGFANPSYATLRTASHKLHHSMERGATVRQLYDIRSDPGETTDILADLPELATELNARLDTFIAQRMAHGQDLPKTPGSEALKSELEERGYWEMVREPVAPRRR